MKNKYILLQEKKKSILKLFPIKYLIFPNVKFQIYSIIIIIYIK